MLNSVTLVGRVGTEPEFKRFDNGNNVARFRLAVNRPTKEKITDWFDVKVWGKQADTVADYVRKGHLIGIIGALQEEKWETQNGEKRSKALVIANSVRLMQQKDDSQSEEKPKQSEEKPKQSEEKPKQSEEKPKQSESYSDIFGNDDEIPF